jgi:hypothetical protein
MAKSPIKSANMKIRRENDIVTPFYGYRTPSRTLRRLQEGLKIMIGEPAVSCAGRKEGRKEGRKNAKRSPIN